METQKLMRRAKSALESIEEAGAHDRLDPDELGCLKGIAKGYQSFMSPAAERLLSDIEHKYRLNGKNRRIPLPFGVESGAETALSSERKGVKVHHGAHGEVYELSPEAKMADVIKSGEKASVSLDRWLAATLLGDRCEDKAAVDYARDAKSMATSSTGILLPVGYQAEWTDSIRAQMVLQAAGMTTATMSAGQVTSSRIISDPPVGWRAEGGELVAGDPTFELQHLIAKSLAVRVQSTAELAQDSPEWGAQLMNVMTKALATEIDRVGLVGTGTAHQPRGIVNTPGVGSVAGVGSMSNYTPFVRGLQTLLEANCELSSVDGNAIMSPRTWGDLESLQASDGQPLMRPNAIERMAFRPTTSIPNDLGEDDNESVAVLGDFSQLVLGVRMEATVEALKLQSYASNLLLEFVGWTRVDFLVRRPASFTVLRGITPYVAPEPPGG